MSSYLFFEFFLISFSEVTEGSCISVFGRFQESIGKEQDIEFLAEEIKVHGACDVKVRVLSHPVM